MSRLIPPVRFIALIVLTIIAPRSAVADPKADAQTHIDKAQALFANDRPTDALGELNTAYALDPRPEILYAIGQAYASLGQCADAKTSYERFLASKPSKDVANVANEAIAACKDKPHEAAPKPAPTSEPAPRLEPAPTPAPQPATTSRSEGAAPWYSDYVGDALVSAGLVSGIVALVEYRAAKNDRAKAAGARDFQSFSDLIDSANHKRTTSIVFGAAGVALVVGGLARFLFHDRGSEGLRVVPTSGGAAVSWGARF